MKFLAWPEEPARCQQGHATPMIDINTSLLDFSHRRFPGSEVEGLAVVQFETFCGRKVKDGPWLLFSAGLAFQRTTSREHPSKSSTSQPFIKEGVDTSHSA